ncbi:adenylate/guanylate cyclase domain-containing protein [uncultured Algibacter sp.]|jgi:class 3 adenylate cyclase|uniref:adenylate/guanylate cyclase domain-containing protein n=1 Tax=uncultured Algibacter sp. TaxID=298659 RepID=UPI00263102C5|nr:adenylate/guanylate cyclase domain-containing protein [uncultured Algibacter sp.]
MPNWNKDYWNTIKDHFSSNIDGLDDRVESVTDGRITPALEDIAIGSGRKMRTVCLFFDIRGFTSRTDSSNLDKLKETLYMLNCVIPTVMKIIYDYNGYIEKNTGDGIMALIGAEDDDETSAMNALNASLTIFYALNNLINPHLEKKGIKKVDARIGIDLGQILITRIGLPTGTSKHKRNFLTAVGPTANIASKIQNASGTNEIWVGDQIKQNASEYYQKFFKKREIDNWIWVYEQSREVYNVWKFDAHWKKI